MPPKPYRKKVEVVQALQYDGTNRQELLEFAPDYLEVRTDDNLWVKRSPRQVVATDWVYKNHYGTDNVMADADFVAFWDPGGPV
jgi:hypothetical protein